MKALLSETLAWGGEFSSAANTWIDMYWYTSDNKGYVNEVQAVEEATKPYLDNSEALRRLRELVSELYNLHFNN